MLHRSGLAWGTWCLVGLEQGWSPVCEAGAWLVFAVWKPCRTCFVCRVALGLPFSILPVAVAFLCGMLPFVSRLKLELSLVLSPVPAQEDDGLGANRLLPAR